VSWNGVLVLYAHGYVAPQSPLSLPAEELSVGTLPDGRSVIDVLMDLGFAFATTSYSRNGWAVEDAEGDLTALVEHFKGHVASGPLRDVLITGASEGGLITSMMIEKHAETYAGGLAMCGPVGGAPDQTEYVGDFRVVFDYFFPWVFDYGFTDYGSGAVPADDYLLWEGTYGPAVERALLDHPLRRFQLFNVTKAPMVPGDPDTAVTTAQTVLRYTVVGSYDLIDRAGGVMPYNNLNTRYRGSFNDWWLNRKVERVDGEVTYLQNYYQTTGALTRPLVTLHTLLDGAVPFRHELRYYELVRDQGKLQYLTVLPVARYGHCNFKPEEVLGAFALLFLQTELQAAEALTPYIESLPEPMP
jgi:hypothetical protein